MPHQVSSNGSTFSCFPLEFRRQDTIRILSVELERASHRGLYQAKVVLDKNGLATDAEKPIYWVQCPVPDRRNINWKNIDKLDP